LRKIASSSNIRPRTYELLEQTRINEKLNDDDFFSIGAYFSVHDFFLMGV